MRGRGQWLTKGAVVLFPGNELVVEHGGEHHCTAFLCLLGRSERGVKRRRLWQRRKERRLTDRKPGRMFTEIGLSGSFYAEGPRPEIGLVEVQPEYLIFG